MGIFTGADSNHERYALFTVCAVFLFVSWVTVLLRVWVRLTVIKKLGWDDATLVLAVVSFTGFCLTLILPETPYGGAYMVDKIPFEQIERLTLIIISGFVLYVSSMVLLKMSLGIFYLRIVIRDWQRYVVYAVVSFNTVWGIVLIFLAIFQCGGNVSKYLIHQLADICAPVPVIYRIQLVAAIINALTDWTFAIIPIFVLVKSTMPLRTKFGAGLVLLLGCIGSVISLARIPYIKGLSPGPNFFQTAVELGIWSTAEIGLIIIAASAATLRPLLRVLGGSVSLSSLRRSTVASAPPTVPMARITAFSTACTSTEKDTSTGLTRSSTNSPTAMEQRMDDLEDQRAVSVASMVNGRES